MCKSKFILPNLMKFKGVYTIEQLVVDKNLFLKYLESGSYKGHFCFYKKDSAECSSMFGAIARFY